MEEKSETKNWKEQGKSWRSFKKDENGLKEKSENKPRTWSGKKNKT